MTHIAHQPDRSVVIVAGPDRVAFLQGLVSNDVALAAPGQAVWAALLTPQGKYLADFFVLYDPGGTAADDARLLLDCAAGQAGLVAQRLTRFRLRSQVEIGLAGAAIHVAVAWGGVPHAPDSVVAPDPRLPDAGWRILSARPVAANATAADWDLNRIRLGLPEGAADMDPDKTVLLEAGFDELHGVSWTKGCYMGQELTARTKYRGLLKRRLLPVRGDGPLPPPGTVVMAGAREAGVLHSVAGAEGLATLRLDTLAEQLDAGGVQLTAITPAWMLLAG